MTAHAIEVDGASVVFPSPVGPLVALHPVTFRAGRRDLVMVNGPSGTGKTTMLSCLGGILRPTHGSITVDGLDVASLSRDEATRYRRSTVGIVFQDFNLIDSLTAEENVALPLWAGGISRRRARSRSRELLDRLGLAERRHHRPPQLSGGQRQRVAIARALAHDPSVLLADEPTANLDASSAEVVLQLLRDEMASGRCVVMATHDQRLRAVADLVVDLLPGEAQTSSRPHTVEVRAGERVFSMGDPSDLVYRVDSGAVRLHRPTSTSAPSFSRVCRRGDHFGELGPVLGLARSANATAVDDCVLTALTVDQFRALASPGRASAPRS